MSSGLLKTRIVLLVRLLLVAFKFLFFFVCGRQLETGLVATLFFINVFITIAVMLAPMETHYNFVRDYRTRDDNYELYSRHFSTLLVIVTITCLILLTMIWTASSLLFPAYLSVAQYSLLIVVIFFESVNTDCYRYFQIDDVTGQIINLALRSLGPFLLFLGFVFIDPTRVDSDMMILLMIAFCFLACVYSLHRIGWPRWSGLHADWFRPDFAQLRFSVKIALPILVAQVVYTQLDKYLAASVMAQADYTNYAFYSSIGQAALLYAQITFIQPQLADWYAGTPEHMLRLRDLAKKAAEMGVLMIVGMGFFVLLGTVMPPPLRPSIGSALVVAGHLSLATATAVTAYLYASKRDSAALKSDALLSGFGGLLLLLFALRQIEGAYLFAYPLAMFTLALIVKVVMLRAR